MTKHSRSNTISVSDNLGWKEILVKIGGTRDAGHREVGKMWGSRCGLDNSGKELTANGLITFLNDTVYKTYDGADTLLKLMYSNTTGKTRGEKYIPKDMAIGSKTGSFASAYRGVVNHEVMTFQMNGKWYALAVLTRGKHHADAAGKPNKVTNKKNSRKQGEQIAIITGGLISDLQNKAL